MSSIPVLVCGTNYGRTYLEAIHLGGPGYSLAGILARGSARSQQIAREYGVALFRSVEDLVPGIDLACAAMGASAFDVVLELLMRGIHVLCEHPQKSSRLESALGAAASRGLCFHINGHFADLEAAAAFIRHCHRNSTLGHPSFFQVTATDRSLHAALDILGRVLISLVPFDFRVTSRFPPFTVVQGFLNGVPATFQIQCSVDGRSVPDASPSYLVDHRIAIGFPSGILTLLSMNGPVIWNANLNCTSGPEQPLFTVLHESCALNAELLYQQRIAANLRAIAALAKNISDGLRPPEQAPNYLLAVSRTWETVGGLL